MKLFNISELANMFGLSRSTLIYYDKIGLLSSRERTASGYRQYSCSELEKLKQICFYRESGLSLADISNVLENRAPSSTKLRDRFLKISEEIVQLKSQQRMIAEVLKLECSNDTMTPLNSSDWLSIQHACCLDSVALRAWHKAFEVLSPESHHQFLLELGLDEKEAVQVRMLTMDIEHNAEKMETFYDLFLTLPRQGPGSDELTLKAIRTLRDLPDNPRVLDVGCGTGSPTKVLATHLQTEIIALDIHKPFLDKLDLLASKNNLPINTVHGSMSAMPFEPGSFDLIWSEASLFTVGLENGLRTISSFLRSGGYLAFSEMVLCREDTEPDAYLKEHYADIRSHSKIVGIIDALDLQLCDMFWFPEEAWYEDYYGPLSEEIERRRSKSAGESYSSEMMAKLEEEIGKFQEYKSVIGYAFYIVSRK